MAILVMLSNYMHDLATAVFAVSAVIAYLLRRSHTMQAAPETIRPLVKGVVRLGAFSLACTLLLGFIRGLTYREYEWVEAVGRNQVPALVVKHVFLVALVVTGIVFLYRLRRLQAVAEVAEASR